MPSPSKVVTIPHERFPPRPIELCSAEPCWVRMLTATVLVVEQPFAAIEAGLKETDELAGSPVAENVMVPV